MNHKKCLRKRYSATSQCGRRNSAGGDQFLFWPVSALGHKRTLCSADANAHDVCKIKMIVDRARIGSTLPKLIGVGVKTARRDFFQSEDIKRFVVSGWSCQ